MLIVFFRAVILYILIVISIRLMGKRQIGELQPSELVITLLLSKPSEFKRAVREYNVKAHQREYRHYAH